MITKLKKEAETLFITICYINHHLKRNPEMIKRAISEYNLKGLTGWNISIEDIEATKSIMEMFVDFPEYKFSDIITKDTYQEITTNTIENLRINYLEVSKNRLAIEERKMIFAGVQNFLDASENNIIPYFNRFTSTQHDRIAYNILTKGYLLIGLAHIIKAVSQFLDEKKMEGEDTKLIQQIENSVVLKDRIEKDDSLISESSINKTNSFVIPEIGELDANNQKNSLASDFWALFNPPEKIELKDKALEKYYMDSIYEGLKSIMPTLSAHRLYILCGYVSWGFGIIKEEDFKNSRYTTLNEFFTFKVKGILRKT